MAAPQPLRDTPQGPALVLIGPEGGFVPFELALAQAVIARPVHLGLRSLSVDTAVTTVLAQGCLVHQPSSLHGAHASMHRGLAGAVQPKPSPRFGALWPASMKSTLSLPGSYRV